VNDKLFYLDEPADKNVPGSIDKKGEEDAMFFREKVAKVSTEINFDGISIGIPFESSDVQRNYWSKLLKLIGIPISISIIGIKIPTNNRIRYYDIKSGIPMSKLKTDSKL
jgi:hypothetical protein